MAANSGAYYEGLQYASQGVEPVNFGELSMGFAKIVEDKRLEEKRDREKKEDFQMEMTKLFGEEIYSAFDGTGLADADILASKIKDSIVGRANVVNSLYENGKLTRSQVMQEMVKLNAQSTKYATAISSISDTLKKQEELGAELSESSKFMLNRIDDLMKNAVPVVDASGKFSLLSKDGDVLTSNPFDELQKLLDVRKRYDTESIINSVVAARGQEQIIRDGQVIKKPRDIGESDEKAFTDIVNSLDDEDMFDIVERIDLRDADGNRLKASIDNKSVFKITNREELKGKIVEYLKESAQAKINSLESVDEVAGENVQSQRRRDAIALGKLKTEEESFAVNKTTEGLMKGVDFLKPVTLNTLPVTETPTSNINMERYTINDDGQYVVDVAYYTLEDRGITQSPDRVLKRESIVLTDLSDINSVRVRSKLPPLESLPVNPNATNLVGQNLRQIGPQIPQGMPAAKPKLY